MNMSRLRASIRKHEGVKAFVYDDANGNTIGPGDTVLGHPTIGVGRNLYTRGLSPDEIDVLLSGDLKIATTDAYGLFENFDRLGSVRQEVLVEMAFNLGRAGLRSFRRFRGAVLREDWQEAGRQMLDSRWARQVGQRAITLAARMTTGHHESDMV